jgi:hypothetical protein
MIFFSGNGMVSCEDFQSQICAAMVDCVVTVCEDELAAYYGCGWLCEPIQCNGDSNDDHGTTTTPPHAPVDVCDADKDKMNQCLVTNTDQHTIDCLDENESFNFVEGYVTECSILTYSICLPISICFAEVCVHELESFYSCGHFCDIDCSEYIYSSLAAEDECDAAMNNATQCLDANSPSCAECWNTTIMSGNSTLSCDEFESDFCDAIVTCNCTACQKELEAAYSCGLNCETLQCTTSLDTVPSPSSAKAVVGICAVHVLGWLAGMLGLLSSI